MFLLATLLTFGWPEERTVFLPASDQSLIAREGLIQVHLNPCCGSMRPAFRGGETAYAIPYDHKLALVGRIISNKHFTHRVLAETAEAIYTSGDANRVSDGWSPKSEVIYVIKYIIRP